MGAEGIQAIRVDPVSCSTCKYTWLPSRLTRLTHLRGQWAAKGLWSLTSLQSELGASRLTSGGEVVHKPRPEVAEAAKMSPAQAGWRSPLAQTKHSSDLKSLKFEKKKKVFHAKHTDMMSWLAMPHSHHKGKREKRKKINFCYSTPESSSLLSKTQSPCAPKKKKKGKEGCLCGKWRGAQRNMDQDHNWKLVSSSIFSLLNSSSVDSPVHSQGGDVQSRLT